MLKPNKILLQYIQENKIKQLKKCNHQTVLKIDYTLFNHYFNEQTTKNFFDYKNYQKIINDVEKEINKDNDKKNKISIKLVDVPPTCNLHDLDANYIGDLISTKAMIKNITESNPTLETAVYECRGCMRLINVDISDNIVTEPTLCPECGGKSFRLLPDLSTFRDYRLVKLEEPLEYRTGGSTREFKGYMQDYLASPQHNLKAGDVVDIIGEFKVQRTNKNNKNKDYEFLIDLHNITSVNNPFEDYRITEEDKKEILQLSKTDNIYERLWKSLAPEIVGYEYIKQGLLLQLFEGRRPVDDTFKHDYIDRWTTHILIIGDPGIGKSQLISSLTQKVPKIININGADTSKAGLTTSAVKDELTGAWTLEAGAIVLADTGVLCIDEFDKLPKNTQKSLNQPMEQLTVSSAKAGLVQTMSARTSVIAIANPKYSRFNPYKLINEQIDIPDSTLSRFDLVFALNDRMERQHDINVASALLNQDKTITDDDLIDEELFKKYIQYAKLECFPVLSDEAKTVLTDFYVDTRQVAKMDDSAKPITARDLKAIERLTIARAKIDLRDVASVNDAECAIAIYSEALRSIGLTPETRGKIENVLSDGEMKLINEVEDMIKARIVDNKLDDGVVDSVKHEIGLICYERDFNREVILDNALKNVKNELGV